MADYVNTYPIVSIAVFLIFAVIVFAAINCTMLKKIGDDTAKNYTEETKDKLRGEIRRLRTINAKEGGYSLAASRALDKANKALDVDDINDAFFNIGIAQNKLEAKINKLSNN
ncbi:hypothetical protein [Vibrio phage vB_VhaS-a]|nr:hypothetical protein [Vibrio phage vB_VhaS-a]